MNEQVIRQLQDVLGGDYVLTHVSQTEAYWYDEMEPAERPEAHIGSIVVKPASADEIAAVMKIASAAGVNVVVRGGGTGLCGGAIPVLESIVLSMERLKRVVEIDTENMMAVLEGGVTLHELLETLKGYPGVGFPVHPGDEGAQIGGMAVTNAGGARAVRHGIMRNHIKGMQVVLANGEIMRLGGKLLKDNAGYSLMHLIIGSEGTLGIVTEVTLRLYPEEKETATLAVAFESMVEASKAVLEVLKSGVTPLAVEYQDKHLNLQTAEALGLVWPLQAGRADLLFILSERTETALYHACAEIDRICQKHGALETAYAETRQEQADLLAVRSGSYELIKSDILYSFDLAVPPASIPAFMSELLALFASYKATTNMLAHIADGNLHHDILLVEGKEPEYAHELKMAMYTLCFKHQGTITGEHGIGKLRVEDLKLQKSQAEWQLMAQIKQVFDPKGILNAGTVVALQ